MITYAVANRYGEVYIYAIEQTEHNKMLPILDLINEYKIEGRRMHFPEFESLLNRYGVNYSSKRGSLLTI
ncbi:hypothetical protein HNP86_001792 [Methanococcus maripaludis]|uniref:Uncharacterized protein n=1 Tax=Methanococcus maripaludis TaxID=39152 RepID=A0A7J9NX92_METMI|nr:hypothetical protein [Methanococcus maripaludis]MBA2851633.1 hypothetical protein [Methanococcus maripaludis]